MAEKVATIYDYMRFQKAFCSKGISCACCPLGIENNGEEVVCRVLLTNYTDKANEIILQWCDEHPQKTYKDDFLEKFPNAVMRGSGIPLSCKANVYGCVCKGYVDCKDCWNEVYEK